MRTYPVEIAGVRRELPIVQVGPGVAVALLTGSQLLLGYPQYVWFSLLAEAAWGSLVLWQREGGRLFRVVLALGWAKLVGLLLARQFDRSQL